MRKITADYIYPVRSAPIKGGVIIIDNSGKIIKIAARENFDLQDLEIYDGIIVPGFINTHCHLELSHMKGMIPSGMGLIPFIKDVVTKRDASIEVITKAMEAAELEMLNQGIVAVGDISNTTDSFDIKSGGPMHYYTFVEYFDFLQDANAPEEFKKYSDVFLQLDNKKGSYKSHVPHAPYSVSPELFRLIQEANSEDAVISIHNQETPAENELFLQNSGGFVDFYKAFDIGLNNFDGKNRTSIHYAMEHLDPNQTTLFVHNTLTTKEEIEAASAWSSKVFWATCPNANLYIENRLPDYRAFVEAKATVTIGTDSLTSNWQLSIIEEMKTILKHQSFLSFDDVLRWGTLNGAKALGFENEFGSLEIGKTPGLNLLSCRSAEEFGPTTTVKVLT